MLTQTKGNLLAAIDFETTGAQPGYHEIIHVAVVPAEGEPFNCYVRPQFKHRADPQATRVHGLTFDQLEDSPLPEQAADLLREWVGGLGLCLGRWVVPIAHNWGFEVSFLKHWLGVDQDIFHSHARDTMQIALHKNDLAIAHGRPPPFERLGLKSLCDHFGITYDEQHDALADAQATLKLYQELLNEEI